MRIMSSLFALTFWAFAALAPASAAVPAEPAGEAFSYAADNRPLAAALEGDEFDFYPRATWSAHRIAAPEAQLATAEAQPAIAPSVRVDDLVVPAPLKGERLPSGLLDFVVDKWFCYDSAGGLPPATEVGRIAVLWPCDGSPRQAFTFEDGVLYVGPEKTAQLTVDIKPWYQGCFERTNQSELRFYTFGGCADLQPGETKLEMNLSDPSASVIRGHMPVSEDRPAAGRPIVVAPVNEDHAAKAQWEYDGARKLLRLAGTNLCVTPPYGDKTRGAVLTLDDCDQPAMALDGTPGPTDGRARVEALKHKKFKN